MNVVEEARSFDAELFQLSFDKVKCQCCLRNGSSFDVLYCRFQVFHLFLVMPFVLFKVNLASNFVDSQKIGRSLQCELVMVSR